MGVRKIRSFTTSTYLKEEDIGFLADQELKLEMTDTIKN